jgi:hypothetical protein
MAEPTQRIDGLPEVAARVIARVRAAADPRAIVEAYGSSVYAPAYADDVDVLVSNDDAGRLAAALGLTALPTTPPRLTGTLEGAAVDVTIVSGDTDLARRMRAGPRDASMLAAELRVNGRDAAFQAAWPHVRAFVQTRALGRNGLGWFGSFGWAVLLAVPLVHDVTLRAARPGSVLPAWLRWLARFAPGARIGFDAIRHGEPEPFFLVAPSPPTRDIARLGKRAASVLFAEARAGATAVGDATTDADAIARIADLADDPPAGTTLVITGDDDHVRGRYEGIARGLLRELEPCNIRSWGRFDEADGSWQHRITVAKQRTSAARTTITRWLALNRLDAGLEE